MTALKDWFHLVTDASALNQRVTRTATAEERAELARELDILACDSLVASYTISPLAADRLRFEGRLEADVAQACVVTLDPVPARIDETFSVEVGPPELLAEEPQGSDDREILSAPDVEPIVDGRVEVGAILFGILSAALPPYPRRPDAAFEWADPKASGDPASDSPFAALAKLKPPT